MHFIWCSYLLKPYWIVSNGVVVLDVFRFFSYSNRVISRLIRLLFRWCVCSIFNIISYNLFDTARSQESSHQVNTVPIESDELIWIHCMHRQTGCRMQIRHFNWYFLNRVCHRISHVQRHPPPYPYLFQPPQHLLHICGENSNGIIIHIQVYLLCHGSFIQYANQ